MDDVLDEALKRHIDGIRAPRSCSIIKDITGCDIDADMHSDDDKTVDKTLAAAIDYSDSTTVVDEDEADIITHRDAVATMSTCELAEQENSDDGTKQDVMVFQPITTVAGVRQTSFVTRSEGSHVQ